jgi:hypothetical protein
VPDLVLATHGRYVFAHSGGGWELRENVDARRRARWVVGGLLLGAAAVIWDRAHHPFAFAPALLGVGLVIAGLRKKGRRLVIRDAEIAWGHTGDDPVRTAVWPRARIASVLLERGSRLADPKLRRRAPVWTVRIRARDGDLHPASFTFSTEATARALAETLARRLEVELDVVDAGGGALFNRSRRRSDRRPPAGTAPRPERLDPR